MKENFVDSGPFLCIEVNEDSKLQNLQKRFDTLFPNRVIRLMINGQYTSCFYLGKGMWYYLKTPQKQKPTFVFKILINENLFNYINDDEIDFLDYININIDDFEVIGGLSFNNQSLPNNYMFLSNGTQHIFQQYNMNINVLYELFSNFLDCEVVFDSRNQNNTGMLIVNTKTNIFGEDK